VQCILDCGKGSINIHDKYSFRVLRFPIIICRHQLNHNPHANSPNLCLCDAYAQSAFQLAIILQQTLDTSSQPFVPFAIPPASTTINHKEMATYK
jgi:hypothetical protein